MAKKKTTKKKAAGKKKAAARTAAPKIPSAAKVRTKGEVYRTLAENTGLSRQQVVSVFDVMTAMMEKDLKRGGPGTFNVPGLMRVKVQRKPATKARKGRNPFTGEEIMIKAKPARNVVRVRPLKTLKDLVA